MGADINSDFVDIRDRTSGKPYHMLVPSTLEFDFNNDKTIDIALALKNVERGVNAYFAVTPYPATTPAENAPEENPTQPAETSSTIPSETPTTTQPQEKPAAQAPVKQTQKEPSGQQLISGQENTKSKSSWLVLVLLVIVLAVILAIALARSNAKKLDKKTTKKDAKKEMPEQEQQPVQQEKFDIIKSTGRKR